MNPSQGRRPNDGLRWRIPPPKPPAPWTKGYFAFPPILNPDGRVEFTFAVNQPLEGACAQREQEEQRITEQEKIKEHAWQEHCRREEELRQVRLEQTRAEALKGEMAWVRAGGVLYDRQGRRDDARTEELRAEIRLQDEEKRVMEQWNAYEDRWRILLATDTPVAFADVPWPLSPAPVTASELTSEAVEKFLFAPLNVRQNTVTKRERIRASLLRWHPDKVSAVLQRVVEGDADAVRNGVNTVFLCLRALQDKDRQLGISDV